MFFYRVNTIITIDKTINYHKQKLSSNLILQLLSQLSYQLLVRLNDPILLLYFQYELSSLFIIYRRWSFAIHFSLVRMRWWLNVLLHRLLFDKRPFHDSSEGILCHFQLVFYHGNKLVLAFQLCDHVLKCVNFLVLLLL